KFLLKSMDEHFSPTILRNATAFGISPRMRFDLVVNNLAGIAWTQKKIVLLSDGTPWRSFAHVLDISKAAACALEAPLKKVRGQIFNVGQNKDTYQIKTIAEMISDVFPNCPITYAKRGSYEKNYRVSDYRVNFNKITSQLPNFSCDYTVRRGIEDLRAVFENI